MKKILLIIIVLVFTACAPTTKKGIKVEAIKDVAIIKIDGCEYVTYSDGRTSGRQNGSGITHKGNCSNPIHQQ